MDRFCFSLAFLFAFVFFGQSVFGDAATDSFSAAKSSFDFKQYEQARAGFNAFLVQYPTHAQATEATYYLAESLLYLKQYVQAETYYNRLIKPKTEESKLSRNVLVGLSDYLQYQQLFDNSETYYNQLITLGLDNPFARAALFRLADIPYLQGKFDVAKPQLEAFVDKLPKDNNLQFVLFYLGDIAMRTAANTANVAKIAEEAEWYFEQCDNMFPNGAKSLENKIGLAWAKNQLGKTTEADYIFQQLLSNSDPFVVETATYQWGVTQFERGYFQAASATLTDFQSRWPASIYFMDSLRVLARCKGSLGDYDGALQLFARISPLADDDNLVKVRCLYGSKQTQQAQSLLSEIERRNDPAYRDEIALLQSVFLFDQSNWQGTILKLESILSPQYNASTGRMTFYYLTQSSTQGVQKLNDESFLKACSLLAQAYAKSGSTAQANAILQEMQSQAMFLNRTELSAIVTETQKLLAGPLTGTTPLTPVTSLNPSPNRPDRHGNTNHSSNAAGDSAGQDNRISMGMGQWSPSGNGNDSGGKNGNANNNRQQPITTGTDLERFNRALQFYNLKNYSAAVQQFEQILGTYYNKLATPKQYTINYTVTGLDGTMNELTFVKACSLLALSKAQLGDIEQANAVFSAMASRANLSDTSQRNLLQETNDLLAELAGNAGLPVHDLATSSPISEAEQRKLLRDGQSLYNSKRYDLAVSKINELIAKKPPESMEAEAILLQSKALYKIGKETEAVVLLERIVNEFSSSLQYQEALWFLGNYYDSYGDTVKSVDNFQVLADRFPNSKHIDGALYFLAVDDLTNGSGRKATSYLIRIYRNYQAGEHWSHATWMLAYGAYKKKDYAQAEIYLQKLLQHPPDIVILDRALYLKGELAFQKNEYDTAFIAFREISKLCPESPLCSNAARNARLAAGKAVNVK